MLLMKLIMGLGLFVIFMGINWQSSSEPLRCQAGNSMNIMEDCDDVERPEGACGQQK